MFIGSLCDCGSAVNILLYDAYQKMGLQDKDLLPTITHVYGFTGDAARVKGMVKLPITLGEEPRIATQIHEFTVVDHSAGYNAIIWDPHNERDEDGTVNLPPHS